MKRVDFVCKKCGGGLYLKAYRAGGWWVELRNADGSIDSTNTDGIKLGREPQTVICGDCGKRNPNPDIPRHVERT